MASDHEYKAADVAAYRRGMREGVQVLAAREAPGKPGRGAQTRRAQPAARKRASAQALRALVKAARSARAKRVSDAVHTNAMSAMDALIEACERSEGQ